jgi:hypothetical protein
VAPIVHLGSDGCSELALYAMRASGAGAALVEGATYKYRLSGIPAPTLLEPSECFEMDPDDCRTGRFYPANHVGTIRVVAVGPGVDQVHFDVEVIPAKLEYETEYRWLLEQIADHAAEAVLQGFAPSVQMAAATTEAAGELAYRSLAFIAARLRNDSFQAAVSQVLRSPHRRWRSVNELRHLGRGTQPGPEIAKSLRRSGSRGLSVPAALAHLPITHVPQVIERSRNEVTYDTNPNRFVRFVLEHWQGLAANLESVLGVSSVGAGPRRRGMAEARWIMGQCDQILAHSVFDDVGRLTNFPHGDPVLLRKPGYREILRVFALAEGSMHLDTHVEDDIFAATQRNIATLYEYWCFLVLVGCLTELCGRTPEGRLFAPSSVGLSLVLKEDSRSQLTWHDDRAGRRLAIDLWFNQSFHRSGVDAEISSWASSIRPDASLRVRPLSGRPSDGVDPHLDTWVHFDAKFRLEGREADVHDGDPKSTARRADLLKMHAYRDLIRRSAGAYVLYPGSGNPQRRSEFHEVLPGIGAFPLRPGPDGTAEGRDALREFLHETLELAANQASVNERRRFWERQHTRQRSRRVQAVSFLSSPPADERVLIGYVRREQLPWVLRKRRYNLRGDDRFGSVQSSDDLLAASLILLWTRDDAGATRIVQLYERTGPWQIVSAEELEADGYPRSPRARAYLVTSLNPVTTIVEALILPIGQLPLPHDQRPVGATWDQVALGAPG